MKKILLSFIIALTQLSLIGQGGVQVTSTVRIPSMTGNAGKVLGTNGTSINWITPSCGSVSIGAISPLFETAGTFSIQPATTSQNGYLTSTNWNTFNNKQPALGYTPYNSTNPDNFINLLDLSATSPLYYDNSTGNFSITPLTITSTGSGTASLSGNTLNIPTYSLTQSGIYSALTYTPYNNSNPSNYISSTELSATSPLFYNNSTGVFTIQPSSTSQSGFLNSTDWNIFNNKLPTTTSITINGITKSYTSTPSFTVTNSVTPEDYGAVGDGTTNDYTALQNAINSGKTVIGDITKTYKTNTSLSVVSNSVLKNINLYTASNIALVTITGNYNYFLNCSFTGSVTLGNGSTNYGLYAIGNAGLTLYRIGNRVDNCTFSNLNTAVYTASMVGTSSGSKHEGAYMISNPIIHDCTNGIFFDVRGEYNSVSSFNIYDCTNAIKNTGGNNNFNIGQFTGNTTAFLCLPGANDGHCFANGIKFNHNAVSVNNSQNLEFSIGNSTFYAGSMIFTGTGKTKIYNSSLSMNTYSLIVTNSPLYFIDCDVVGAPSTYSLTGTAPVMINTYSTSLLMSTPTTTTSSIPLLSGDNLSTVANVTTAINNLLPSQTSNSGKFLTTNGTNSSWSTISGGGDMLASNNLSDVSNKVTARNNILPSKTGNSLKVLRVNSGETDYEVATFAGGGDMVSTNNLSDLANPITARNNLKEWNLFLTAGDQTTTSNTAANITALVTPTLTINKRYRIEGIIRVGCNNTGGIKIQITVPTGATLNVNYFGFTSGATAFTQGNIITSATLSAALNTVNSGNGSYKIDGEIQMSSTAGTVQFGFASGTNTQTSTIYQLGTMLTIKQIN